jgi:DNA-binding NtrC family response regulator
MTSILCVDKYKNQRLLYEQELSLEGYEVITASDTKDACEIVETRQPGIIIMDVCMLSMSSVKAMCSIVSKHKDIPLIIYTAYGSYKDVFMSWAADAYIVKSSDMTELKNKIKELLKKGVVAV